MAEAATATRRGNQDGWQRWDANRMKRFHDHGGNDGRQPNNPAYRQVNAPGDDHIGFPQANQQNLRGEDEDALDTAGLRNLMSLSTREAIVKKMSNNVRNTQGQTLRIRVRVSFRDRPEWLGIRVSQLISIILYGHMEPLLYALQDRFKPADAAALEQV